MDFHSISRYFIYSGFPLCLKWFGRSGYRRAFQAIPRFCDLSVTYETDYERCIGQGSSGR
jgi:hypothetical protein